MSTTPHKASAEQWKMIADDAIGDCDLHCLCILELRDRVEALEAAQREAAMNELRAASAEARPSTNEGTSYCELNMPEQQSQSAMTNCHLSGPAPSPHRSWSEWFETEGSKGVIHGIRMEALPFRSSAQQEIADAEAFGLTSTSGSLVERVANSQSTPNDRQIRSSAQHELADAAAFGLAPADHFPDPTKMVCTDSLVERVEEVIMNEDWMNNGLDESVCGDDDPTYRYTSAACNSGHSFHTLQSRAAIREVAAWLRDRGGYPWAWVAQTLELEANQ
jgi:hypothetical protein